VIPHETTAADVGLFHLHIDKRFGEEDLDVVLPTHRLEELARAGFVGRSAPSHYSVMGYILRPRELEEVTAPAIAARMKAEGVDAARPHPCLTVLLPVRGTGPESPRSERHRDGVVVDDSCLHCGGRRAPAGGNRLPAVTADGKAS